MPKKTRKEDAASIVGEEEASKLEARSKANVARSDAFVEMSEGEEPTAEETQELIDEAEAVEEAPVVPAEAPTPAPVVEEAAQEPETPPATPIVNESGVVANEADADVSGVVDVSNMPFNGATSMKEAKSVKESVEEMYQVVDLWGMFSSVAWNIIDRGDIKDKKNALVKALDEFKSMLAAKAMIEFSQAPVAVQRSEDAHPLQSALDALLSAIDNSVVLEGDVNVKLQAVQPVLIELGNAITDYVTQKSVSQPPATNEDADNLLEKITELIRPLSEKVESLTSEIGILKSQASATAVVPKSRIPQPRSLPATLVQKSVPAVKPGSLRDIARKSVGGLD